MSDAPPKKQESAGAPAWVMTFADLMSLLMCFFVLLLSFSQMDLEKFKQVAGSMKLAFGVQREIKADETPKGTSIIAQEFSSGRPDPTPMNEVRQKTTDDTKQSLEFTDILVEDRKEESETIPETNAQTQADAEQLKQALKEEIEQGLIKVDTEGNQIKIRIKEKASFPSGLATVRDDFVPVIEKLKTVLVDIKGKLIVAGHSDDIPIKTARFRSNWELSSARAVSVVHHLLDDNVLESKRFLVEGHGDADPLLPNDTPENRAINRRVELTVIQGGEEDPIGTEQEMDDVPSMFRPKTSGLQVSPDSGTDEV